MKTLSTNCVPDKAYRFWQMDINIFLFNYLNYIKYKLQQKQLLKGQYYACVHVTGDTEFFPHGIIPRWKNDRRK